MPAIKDVYQTKMVFRFTKGSKTFNNIKNDASADDVFITFSELRKLYKAEVTGCEITTCAKILSA